ncbi:hypothetical protein HK107_03115 [Parvularcula sp. ZS-1/3]|uniref:PRC-barrel domain-containing protein n=1 Tax=Parvularcula mediterranea TaxID=2732508 RepID=A0A7Y3RKF8_9PROT|nr:PRC-barrel domain-containing protein [Parvularcula mediterranea]NNU15315.1 hypothetical protein [Parvularcula mediterranea]
MSRFLSTTAISTLMLCGVAVAQEADTETKDVEEFVEPSAEAPAAVSELDQDALDKVDDAETLNEIVLKATTGDGEGQIVTDEDGERRQVTADASTTPDMPEQEDGNWGDKDKKKDWEKKKTASNAEKDWSDKDMDEKRTASSQPMDRDVFDYTTTVRLRSDALNAARIIGEDIDGTDGEEIADLEDLIINADGQVTEAVVKAGGVLGLGEKTYVVAFDQLRFMADDDDEGELDIAMPADKESVEALARWDADEFAIGEDGFTLASELQDAELAVPGSDEIAEVEDIMMTASGKIRAVIIDFDDLMLALPYDTISVTEGDAEDDAGYRISLSADEFSMLPNYEFEPSNFLERTGDAIENAVEKTGDAIERGATEVRDAGAAALNRTEEEAEEAAAEVDAEMDEAEAEAAEAARDVKRETEELERDVENAAAATTAEARETANEAEAEVRETAEEAENAAENAASEVEEEAEEAEEDVEQAAEEVEEEVEEETSEEPYRR